jgi:lysophospholipid acyltransferase (LPLAT)-like uncharacterized protein
MKIKLSRFSFLIRLVSILFFNVIGRTNTLKPLSQDYQKQFQEQNQNYIIATFHSQLLLPVYYFCPYGLSVIISQSEDGEIVTQAVNAMGLEVVRGSSSRSGAKGLLGLVRKLNEGKHAIITPDGPRGPKETVQMGIITLAKLSGYPILPAALDCTKKIRFNSWDHFIVPYPFGTIVYDTGEHIMVPKDADDELMEQKRLELESVLRKLTSNVNDYVSNLV